MTTVAIRFVKEDHREGGALDSANAIAEEDVNSAGTAVSTSITATGEANEICIVYPLSENQRVAFGAAATTSAGPIAFAGVPNAFRDIPKGVTISVITAT